MAWEVMNIVGLGLAMIGLLWKIEILDKILDRGRFN
jgi:hypothetical protein